MNGSVPFNQNRVLSRLFNLPETSEIRMTKCLGPSKWPFGMSQECVRMSPGATWSYVIVKQCCIQWLDHFLAASRVTMLLQLMMPCRCLWRKLHPGVECFMWATVSVLFFNVCSQPLQMCPQIHFPFIKGFITDVQRRACVCEWTWMRACVGLQFVCSVSCSMEVACVQVPCAGLRSIVPLEL